VAFTERFEFLIIELRTTQPETVEDDRFELVIKALSLMSVLEALVVVTVEPVIL